MIPKLIPFYYEYKQCRPDTLVQGDGATSHSRRYQMVVYSRMSVPRLLWLGKSPDLNAIEPMWFWMKKETKKQGMSK